MPDSPETLARIARNYSKLPPEQKQQWFNNFGPLPDIQRSILKLEKDSDALNVVSKHGIAKLPLDSNLNIKEYLAMTPRHNKFRT